MSNMWFRMYAEFAYDPKVQVLPEEMQRRYVMLLCLHCSDNLTNKPDDEIALALRVTADIWRVTKTLLIDRGLIDAQECKPHGWDKRQYVSDLKDPTAAKRQKRYRDRKRNATVTSRLPDTDTERKKEERHPKVPQNRFDEFWDIFPKQRIGNKAKAQSAYQSATRRAGEQEIISGTTAYAGCDEVARGYAKGASAWLNDDRWKSDYSVKLQIQTQQKTQRPTQRDIRDDM